MNIERVRVGRLANLLSLGRLATCPTLAVAALGLLATAAIGADRKGTSMSYQETRDFLAKHTGLIELNDEAGARVAVAPEWQGRVMTSTCGGPEGPSFGFVNRDYIAAGKTDPHFNNYGAEDRLWLSPEGGQFSLFFKPGASQSAGGNWYTPPAFNQGAWEVVTKPTDTAIRMTAHMKLQNASGTRFELDATREVRLLSAKDFRQLFGGRAADILREPGVSMVGFETANTITDRGTTFDRQTGLISIWILGQMNAGPQTVVIVPYRGGPEADRGPVVKSDYCGPMPAERLKVLPEAVLFRADGRFRSKIGVSQRRARNVLGSIDFQAGVLTLVQFTMPDDPAKHAYLNNMCEVPQAEPYRGDVVNSYNDGPNAEGRQFGVFYEIETLSPAPALKTGESLVHANRTIHVRADAAALRRLAKETLGVDLDAVRQTIF
jgi:hypothetical protein